MLVSWIGVRLGGQIQHALANSAGHVEAVHDVLIVILALAVGAGIHLLFGGEVVDARCRTAGSRWFPIRRPPEPCVTSVTRLRPTTGNCATA